MGILNSCPRIGNLGLLGVFLRLSVIGNHTIFFVSRADWETLIDDFWGEVLRLLRKWKVLVLGAYFHDPP